MARYFLRFRHSDTGLTPTFLIFKKASDLSVVTPPGVGEVGSGTYYFDYSPTFDIIFEADGGASIPTEEVRYISDTLSPKDTYIDQSISQVKDDVWNDTVDRTLGTKGDYVENSGGGGGATAADIADAVWDEAVAGHLTAGTTGLKLSETGSVVNIASAVWDEATATHTGFGSFGQALQLQDSGTCKGGASTTIKLKPSASAFNDFFKNGLVVITDDSNPLAIGQARKVTGYVGATQVATVDRAWDVIPITDDTEYMVLPMVPSSSGGGGSGVQFYANGDTVNPILVQVASPKHTQIKVTYSEPVVMTAGANGALNLGNYSVVGLTLLAVTQLTPQQVLITTSVQTANFLYTIVVTNVEDLTGNPIL